MKILFVWLICGILSAGFTNAFIQADDYHWSTKEKHDEMMAVGRSFVVVWSLIGGPMSLIVSAAFTGFYRHGWTLNVRPYEGRL